MNLFSFSGSKLLSICLIESVDKIEVMPSLLARREASVDLPVPLVPHKRIVTDLFLSLIPHAVAKSSSCCGRRYPRDKRESFTKVVNACLVMLLFTEDGT